MSATMHVTELNESTMPFPASLTAAEDDLVVQLKAKYSSGSGATEPSAIDTAPAAPQPPAAPQTATTTATAPVKMCISCSGSGSVSECYDTRYVQRACDACHGSGIRGGGDKGGGRKSAEQGTEGNAGAATSAALRRIAAYEAELASERARLDASKDPREQELRQELVEQLDRQLARLTLLQQRTSTTCT